MWWAFFNKITHYGHKICCHKSKHFKCSASMFCTKMIGEFIRSMEYTTTDLATVLDFKVHRLEVSVKVTLPYELCTTLCAGQLQEEIKLISGSTNNIDSTTSHLHIWIFFTVHSIPTQGNTKYMNTTPCMCVRQSRPHSCQPNKIMLYQVDFSVYRIRNSVRTV